MMMIKVTVYHVCSFNMHNLSLQMQVANTQHHLTPHAAAPCLDWIAMKHLPNIGWQRQHIVQAVMGGQNANATYAVNWSH